MRRALREVQRRSANHYRLKHVKGHQDRTKKIEHMTLEVRLNVKYDALAKGAVTDSVRPGMGPSKQSLPREKASVYVAGEKQISDPKDAIKQEVGGKKAKKH